MSLVLHEPPLRLQPYAPYAHYLRHRSQVETNKAGVIWPTNVGRDQRPDLLASHRSTPAPRKSNPGWVGDTFAILECKG